MRKRKLAAISVTTLVLAATLTLGAKLALQRFVVRSAPVVAAPPPNKIANPGQRCLERRQALLGESAMPGAPLFEAARPEVVARSKSEPVLFLEAPTAKGLPESLAILRDRLFKEGVPWQALNDVFSQLKRYPKRLRQVLLTDGYLWAEKSDLAALLSSGISLSQLFVESEIDVLRGITRRRATRQRDDYVWADGPEAGQPARLWLFDRIVVHGEQLGPNLHVTVGDLRERLGATRIEIERLTRHAALAQLVYAEQSVPALLRIEAGRLELDCEAIAPELEPEIAAARATARRRARVLGRLRVAIAEQIDEALPFDEPKTEEGQQDGKLRGEWKTAYLQGKNVFEFNGDKYPVFGQSGIPRIPQVCVDFITDTWERVADTRWAKRDAGRERHVGRLDFDAVSMENRRSVENLIDFAVAHPDWFELMLIPETERIAFANRTDFFRRLYALRSEFQPGDVVAILGPRDDEKLHYHSFFIIADDPLTSMPTLVAANAGRPRIRTWEGEMQNAPRRSIVARIRPKLEWLERIVGTAP